MITTIYGRGFDSNIYLIRGEKNTIIDTGTGLYSNYVIEDLEDRIDLDEIDQILLTHEHIDHTGGLKTLIKRMKNAKIFAHIETAKALREGKEVTASLFSLPYPKIEVDVKLNDRDKIKIGDDIYTIIHTPGHSKGSICIYCEEKGILFSGDTVFSYGGIGRYDLPGGNLFELEKSIQLLSKLRVKDLYPGHGDIVLGSGDKHIKLSLMNLRSV